MPDFLTRAERSALMSRIGPKNTGIERTVFELLRREGIRFKRHARKLPGHPDIVIPQERIAIFVDGDFWHGRYYSRWKGTLTAFWQKKIEANMARDKLRRRELRRMGWRVIRLWGKEVNRRPRNCLRRILKCLAVPVGGGVGK